MPGFLESKTKLSSAYTGPRAKTAGIERTLTSWSNNNFYRTSYNDMSVKVRVQMLRLRNLLINFV